jgi:hypothetical protein
MFATIKKEKKKKEKRENSGRLRPICKYKK